MAAKIASRGTATKQHDFTPYVVIDEESGKRIYLGDGVAQEQAEAIAAELAHPARAVPAADVDAYGRLIVPDEDAAEPVVEEEAAQALAA